MSVQQGGAIARRGIVPTIRVGDGSFLVRGMPLQCVYVQCGSETLCPVPVLLFDTR